MDLIRDFGRHVLGIDTLGTPTRGVEKRGEEGHVPGPILGVVKSLYSVPGQTLEDVTGRVRHHFVTGRLIER